jgi:plastocyanin
VNARHPGRLRLTAALAAAALSLLAAGCTSAPPAGTASPSAVASSAPSSPDESTSPTAEPTGGLTIDITIADGKVDPNGKKIDVAVGTTVVFKVSSDIDDEIHAHTGGDGYELEVKAGEPIAGSVTVTTPGSFEVESHHLEKVIVILNAR